MATPKKSKAAPQVEEPTTPKSPEPQPKFDSLHTTYPAATVHAQGRLTTKYVTGEDGVESITHTPRGFVVVGAEAAVLITPMGYAVRRVTKEKGSQ